MKKYLVILALALFAASAISFANDGDNPEGPQPTVSQPAQFRNSLEIGYNPGNLSIVKYMVNNKINNLLDFLPIADLLIGADIAGLRSTGTFSLSYMYRTNDWLWVGLNANYEKVSIDLEDYETEQISSIGVHAIPILIVGKASWLRRANVNLYSKLGIGMTPVIIEGGSTKLNVGFQVTPLGVEFGGGHVYGFFEGGIGLQGEMIAGLRFPF